MSQAVTDSQATAAAPPYLAQYQLRTAPFSSAGNGGFFYADPKRAQALDMLKHLTQYGKEVLLVTGPEGVGKSAMLEQYLQRAEEQWSACRLEGGRHREAGELFVQLAGCFNLDIGGVAPDALLGTLQEHLVDLSGRRLPVLLIDDAHLLQDDALEMAVHLAVLEGEHGRLLRVILVGEPSLVERLKEPRFSVGEVNHLELEALLQDEIGPYLQHRLAVAGYSGEPLFDKKRLQRLYKKSGGLPGQLNLYAHMMLMKQGNNTIRNLLSSRKFLLAGGGFAAVALIALAVMLLLGDERQPEAEAEQVSEPLTVARSEAPPAETEPANGSTTPVTEADEAPGDETEAQEPAAAGEPPEEDTPAAPVDEAAQEEVQAAPPAPPAETARRPADRPRIEAIEPQPIIGSDEAQTVTLRGEGFLPGSSIAVAWAGKTRVLASEEFTVVDDEQVDIRLTTGARANNWAVQLTTPGGYRSNIVRFKVQAPVAVEVEVAAEEAVAEEPVAEPEAPQPAAEQETEAAKPAVKPEVKAVAKPKVEKLRPEQKPAAAPTSAKVEGARWLRDRQAGHYTLQLLAASDPQTIDSFLKRNRLPGPLARFDTLSQGRRLHILVQGDYPSRTGAETARSKFSPAIQGSKPWPRSFASIHKVMVETGDAGTSGFTSGKARDSAWLWSQDPSGYTIQLGGAGSEASLASLIKQAGQYGNYAVVRGSREGNPWYTLISGSYRTREEARTAVAKLPAALREAGPWPRSFASIHDELSRTSR